MKWKLNASKSHYSVSFAFYILFSAKLLQRDRFLCINYSPVLGDLIFNAFIIYISNEIFLIEISLTEKKVSGINTTYE